MNDIATRDDIASLGQTVEAMTAAMNAQTDVMRSLAEAMPTKVAPPARCRPRSKRPISANFRRKKRTKHYKP